MDLKSVFNATVCVIGFSILWIHIFDLLFKKERRKDENYLLIFIVFTAFHFLVYFIFTMIKISYTSNNFITGFYTAFYIMNNVELLLVFEYAMAYFMKNHQHRKNLSLINLSVFGLFVVLDIANIFNHMFFKAVNGIYVRSNGMIISQGYSFFAFILIFVLAIISKRLNKTEKIAFATYCVLPFVAIIVQSLLPGYAIGYLSIIISIQILFFFVNTKKNVELANEERRNKEAEVRIMMSQIKPHFVYNTLASISTLITINPEEAQKALDKFTEYLRSNFSSLTEKGLIPFPDELKHINTYLSLEELRFNERIKIISDIQVDNFYVPPLSIQPLVENAVKHGIMKKIEGGTIKISTYETNQFYAVEVEDDGVGFNIEDVDLNSNKHIGLNNVSYRITTVGNGTFDINSQIGRGTKVVVKFYKGGLSSWKY